ncbi:MAG: hypothetical protein ACJ770_07875, partial [Gemmatimonadaceae bacterium]
MNPGVIAITLLATVACHHGGRLDFDQVPEGLRVRAESHLIGKAGDTLQVWMTGENRSREPKEFGYSTCPDVTTRISSAHLTNGKPSHVWDYMTMTHPDLAKPGAILVCSAGAETTVMPGHSVTFLFLSVPVAKILGDSLPAGRYRVTAFP